MANTAEWLKKVPTVAILCFVNLLNYMDRYTIAGILPQLQNGSANGFDRNITDTEGGLLQTSFIISFMVFSPLFGYLGDRYTRKYLMCVGLALWSIFVFVGSFSVNYAMLLASRCLVGIGEASYATIAPTILADHFPVDVRLLVLTVFYMAIPIGSAMGYGIGSFTASQITHHYHQTDSWRWALRITPELGLVMVLLIIFLVIEPPRGNSEVPRSTEGLKAKTGFMGYLYDIWYLLTNKTFMLSTFGFQAVTFAVGALAQWAPTYVYRISKVLLGNDSYSSNKAALVFGIVTVVAGLVGTLSGSGLSKLLSFRTRQNDTLVCAIALLGGAPFLYFALIVGQYNLIGGWLLVFVAEFFLCLPWAPVAAILLYVVVPERRSSAEAIQIFVIHILGDAISPTIVGAVSDTLQPHFQYEDEDFRKAISMQYALFITVFVCALGGGFFLWSSLTVAEDRKAVEQYTTKCTAVNHDQDPNNDGSVLVRHAGMLSSSSSSSKSEEKHPLMTST